MENKRANNSLNKLALSNALVVQNANEKTVNIPTKMLSSWLNEATETSTIAIDLLIILFREGKEPSSSTVIIDGVPKKGEEPKQKAPKTTKDFYWTKNNYQYTFKQGCDYKIFNQALGV